MSTCPYCAHPLLRHISGKQVYWFCRNCWQKVPDSSPDADYNSCDSQGSYKPLEEVSTP